MSPLNTDHPAPANRPIRGVGVSATLDGAAQLCRWRLEGRHAAWRELDYLQLGFYSRDEVPEELPELLRQSELPCVVHLLEVNLVHPLSTQRETVDALVERVEELQPQYVEEDLGLWKWGSTELEQHMLPPVFDAPTLRTVVENVQQLRARLPVPLYVENPPIYFIAGDIDPLDFMAEVATEADCGLILDIGHVVGYAIASGQSPFSALAAWTGISRVKEIHVAGYNLYPDVASAPMWYDNHADPITEEALQLIELVRDRAGWEVPITLEQEGAPYWRIAEHIERVSRRFAA